jgi:hypothetical protein
MTRRISLLLAFLCLMASMPVAAAKPGDHVHGTIFGYEVCTLQLCGQAFFTGDFAGKVNGTRTRGFFLVAVTHGDLSDVTPVTTGEWAISTEKGSFRGTVTEGTLTYNGDETYRVVLMLKTTSGGDFTLEFIGTLDHSSWPTISGKVSG